ncbi:dihydropyrimidinase [Terrilactibacillus laevilacticus]|uniref:Dihydropyrimidinase n=1 Tax=Terrilactibacillus laevilacticus TaxID=1380157 RepID=A0ABW5PS72_9BACI|nr:dihydropyrimidinase [Terrilactibacillus laevilacticus]
MSLIIKGGNIVTDSDCFNADLKIVDGVITSISSSQDVKSNDQVIDASEQYIFPGGIDPHTHLAIPDTVDDFESGTKAAAAGGITTIINYVDAVKGHSLIETLKEWKQKAEPSIIDYGFHSIVNEVNPRVLSELTDLASEEGVTSIKLFMAYPDANMINDEEMYELMKQAKKSGIVTNIHAENGSVIELLIEESLKKEHTSPIYHAYTRPAEMEAEATHRAIRIAELLNTPAYIVHITCEESLKQVIEAKKRGVPIYGETCPHYLILTEDKLKQDAAEAVKYICSPPLRTRKDQEFLWEGIKDHWIDTIGSDHASHPYKDGKDKGINNFTKVPNGLPSIGDSFSLLYHYGVHEKRISLQEFVKLTSSHSAKIFGLYPKKGAIRVGSDADLVIFDPKLSRTITAQEQYQSTEYNVYEGTQVKGAITHVFSRGELIVKNREIIAESGRGQYLYREKYNK